MNISSPPHDHLLAMSTSIGTFEHAKYSVPREELGFCVDDVARVAVFIAREPESGHLVRLGRRSLTFLAHSLDEHGASCNRCSAQGEWHGPHTTEDCWGRLLWATGTTVARSTDAMSVEVAQEIFDRAILARSPWPRATAFGGLGASDLLAVQPDHDAARDYLRDALAHLDRPVGGNGWVWPEQRLTYANAVLPEALLALGVTFDEPRVIERAIEQLRWLLAHETIDGILVPTPAGGLGPDDYRPRFDQQPIEVAALADACARAYDVTRDDVFANGVSLAIRWFQGANSLSIPMFDPETGGGYDGLTALGPNWNQGAESTLALLTTLQHSRVVVGVSR